MNRQNFFSQSVRKVQLIKMKEGRVKSESRERKESVRMAGGKKKILECEEKKTWKKTRCCLYDEQCWNSLVVFVLEFRMLRIQQGIEKRSKAKEKKRLSSYFSFSHVRNTRMSYRALNFHRIQSWKKLSLVRICFEHYEFSVYKIDKIYTASLQEGSSAEKIIHDLAMLNNPRFWTICMSYDTTNFRVFSEKNVIK